MSNGMNFRNCHDAAQSNLATVRIDYIRAESPILISYSSHFDIEEENFSNNVRSFAAFSEQSAIHTGAFRVSAWTKG